LRDEKEIRLRIDLLEGQSGAIAKMLQKAIRNQNEKASSEYSERLALNSAKKEELLWVLAERHGQSVLDLHVTGSAVMSVRQAIEKLKSGELRMADLSAEAQALVRKGALEIRDSKID
jgi:hypothetical protein